MLHGLLCDYQQKAARIAPQDPHAPRAEQEDVRAAETLVQVLLRHDGKRIADVAAACLGPLEQAILGMAANGDNAIAIASELGLEPGTVRQKQARGVTKLQAALAETPARTPVHVGVAGVGDAGVDAAEGSS